MRYSTSADASLMSASPSIVLTSRRGTSKRRRIWVAATGSVGATIAPSANATAHGRSSTSAWIATATAVAVATTSTVDVRVIVRASYRSSRRLAKKAAE